MKKKRFWYLLPLPSLFHSEPSTRTGPLGASMTGSVTAAAVGCVAPADDRLEFQERERRYVLAGGGPTGGVGSVGPSEVVDCCDPVYDCREFQERERRILCCKPPSVEPEERWYSLRSNEVARFARVGDLKEGSPTMFDGPLLFIEVARFTRSAAALIELDRLIALPPGEPTAAAGAPMLTTLDFGRDPPAGGGLAGGCGANDALAPSVPAWLGAGAVVPIDSSDDGWSNCLRDGVLGGSSPPSASASDAGDSVPLASAPPNGRATARRSTTVKPSGGML